MSLQDRFEKIEEEISLQREEYKDFFLHNDSETIDNEYDMDDFPITFDSYQEATQWTAQYPTEFIPDIVYLALGLAGEAGESVDIIKKMYRNNNGVLSVENREKLVAELGDLLYYLSALAFHCGISMADVARFNQKKLLSRLKKNTIKGSGNDR